MDSLDKYVVEEADLRELARGSETGVGRIYREVLAAMLADEVTAMRTNPRFGTDDMRKDLRYKMGLMDGIEIVLKLQDQALELLKRKGK
jgi:hypothetical protein